MFLKIKRGKGSKFLRVPVSQRLRREIIRSINKNQPDSEAPNLLLLASGRPVSMLAACGLLQRLRRQTGFVLHAHKFRHTFATEYLKRGGDNGTPAPHSGPYDLLDGHALRASGQERAGA